MVYNPAKTALLLQAEELNIPCRNGLKMLVAQAKMAGELFQGIKIPDTKIDEISGLISHKTMNVALIGMPGSGKTAVGQCLAGLTDRKLIDTDELISSRAGCDIPSIFAEKGEEYFRKLETEVLREVSKESGNIIATGGGIVTRPENKSLLRQNSVTVMLEYDVNKLATGGRPLSRSVGVTELYRRRKPLYESWSEYRFYNDSPEQIANMIKEALKL